MSVHTSAHMSAHMSAHTSQRQAATLQLASLGGHGRAGVAFVLDMLALCGEDSSPPVSVFDNKVA